MPLYEYQCESCGERLETIQKFSDPLETHCPKCNGNLRKLISSPAIQFKGSGFYITDYARPGSGSDASSGSGGDASPGGGATSPSKSEAKESSGPAAAKSGTAPGSGSD
jgi:putative FmdB family regulatory protein